MYCDRTFVLLSIKASNQPDGSPWPVEMGSAERSLISHLSLVAAKYRVNPDNVATPIVASLGDLVTLAFLALTSHLALWSMNISPALAVAVLAVYLAILPGLYGMAARSELTRNVVNEGWVPILSA